MFIFSGRSISRIAYDIELIKKKHRPICFAPLFVIPEREGTKPENIRFHGSFLTVCLGLCKQCCYLRSGSRDISPVVRQTSSDEAESRRQRRRTFGYYRKCQAVITFVNYGEMCRKIEIMIPRLKKRRIRKFLSIIHE